MEAAHNVFKNLYAHYGMIMQGEKATKPLSILFQQHDRNSSRIVVNAMQ